MAPKYCEKCKGRIIGFASLSEARRAAMTMVVCICDPSMPESVKNILENGLKWRQEREKRDADPSGQ